MTSHSLTTLTADKIAIECDCGMKRRYDRQALLARIGDHDLPSLLRKLAAAEGCERAQPTNVDTFKVCQMGYAEETKAEWMNEKKAAPA